MWNGRGFICKIHILRAIVLRKKNDVQSERGAVARARSICFFGRVQKHLRLRGNLFVRVARGFAIHELAFGRCFSSCMRYGYITVSRGHGGGRLRVGRRTGATHSDHRVYRGEDAGQRKTGTKDGEMHTPISSDSTMHFIMQIIRGCNSRVRERVHGFKADATHDREKSVFVYERRAADFSPVFIRELHFSALSRYSHLPDNAIPATRKRC